MSITRIVILFWLFFTKMAAQAQEQVELGASNAPVPVGLRCSFLEEPGTQKLQSIQRASFVPILSSIPNFGYSNAVIWLKINIRNMGQQRWFLELDNPRMNEVTLYIFQEDRVVYTQRLGDNLPFETYSLPDRTPVFTLPLLSARPYTLYLRASSTEDLKFPLTFWEERQLYAHLAGRNMIWGIYFGFILLITLYNFFLWFMTREAIYGYYSLYVLFFGLFQFSLYGFGYQYSWNNAVFNDLSHIFFLGIAVFFLTAFSLAFLEPYRLFPRLKIVMKAAGLIFVLGFPACLFWYDSYTNVMIIAAGTVMVGIQCFCAVGLTWQGSRTAQLYLIASATLSVAILVVGMKNLGWISAEHQDYYLMGGSMFEIVLFSLALGYRLRSMQLEKLRQQQVRDEISTDLHDDLGATLSSLTMFSELNRRKMQDRYPELADTFGRISERSREAMRLVREAVWEINPHNDTSEEWLDRMAAFAHETFSTRQIIAEVSIDDALRSCQLSIDRRRSLFLFFKEAVNNIAKHSDATYAKVVFQQKEGAITLRISDNGHGFDVTKTTQGNGLRNFKKRAQSLGAQFTLDSGPNSGTSITLTFRAPAYLN